MKGVTRADHIIYEREAMTSDWCFICYLVRGDREVEEVSGGSSTLVPTAPTYKVRGPVPYLLCMSAATVIGPFRGRVSEIGSQNCVTMQ